MMTIRKAGDRGRTNFGWLDSYHTFSFGDYYDPAHHHYRALRVINDDFIAGGGGFPTHPHRDMEILTVMLSGRLAHRDSLGHTQEITPGEWQVMTAGTGIAHSEFNPSASDPAHLLQIWIMPEAKGLTPRYDQKRFEPAPGRWQIVASRDGREGSLVIHQDAVVAQAMVAPGESLEYPVAPNRGVWLHVATGVVTVNGTKLTAGDAVAIDQEKRIAAIGVDAAQLVLFDLA